MPTDTLTALLAHPSCVSCTGHRKTVRDAVNARQKAGRDAETEAWWSADEVVLAAQHQARAHLLTHDVAGVA